MKKLKTKFIAFIAIFPITVHSGLLGPDNYPECIITEMSGIKNNSAAIEVIRQCRKEFSSSTEVKKKTSFFGIETAGECVIKHGKDVSSELGAKHLRAACYKLYPRQ